MRKFLLFAPHAQDDGKMSYDKTAERTKPAEHGEMSQSKMADNMVADNMCGRVAA